MKKIYRPLLKGTYWALAGLVSLLGLGISCGSDDIPAPEYGSPHADFSVKGKVTDESGKPIQGIMVQAQSIREGRIIERRDTVYTDNAGLYETKAFVIDIDSIKVYAKDIDKDKNGSFQNDSTLILPDEIELTDRKGWLIGRGEKEVNFTLKEKADNEE